LGMNACGKTASTSPDVFERTEDFHRRAMYDFGIKGGRVRHSAQVDAVATTVGRS